MNDRQEFLRRVCGGLELSPEIKVFEAAKSRVKKGSKAEWIVYSFIESIKRGMLPSDALRDLVTHLIESHELLEKQVIEMKQLRVDPIVIGDLNHDR